MAADPRNIFGVRPEKAEALARRLESLGVREEDLVERFIRGGGPGGQKTNKTSSGVYLKHLPSGTEVKVHSERSQALNRFLARRQLAERLEAARPGGEPTPEQRRVAKLRKQKRRRKRRSASTAPAPAAASPTPPTDDD